MLVFTLSESVEITIPSSIGREHDGTSALEPSTSTTQTLHTLTGVKFSAQQSVGVSISACLQATKIVEPSGAEIFLSLRVISTSVSEGFYVVSLIIGFPKVLDLKQTESLMLQYDLNHKSKHQTLRKPSHRIMICQSQLNSCQQLGLVILPA